MTCRRIAAALLSPLLACTLAGSLSAHESDRPAGDGAVHGHAYPLRGARARVSPHAMRLTGRWHGGLPNLDPVERGATVRVRGGRKGGDSGTIRLPATGWRRTRRGFRYADPAGGAGGVRRVTLKVGPRGGALRLRAGGAHWRFIPDARQRTLDATLESGDSRWCARFTGAQLVRMGRGRLHARAAGAPAECPCDALVESTWAAVQALFEQRGCAQGPCHGSATAQGGLDLRPNVAHANLVDVPSTIAPGVARVVPGDDDGSLLWQKLAVLTNGLDGVPGSGMPVGTPPLTADELRLVELWIYHGAPEAGVVPDSERLLAASCVPPSAPQKIAPPAPPDPGVGVQLHGPAWPVPIGAEAEVCYATYYDLSDRIPAAMRGPCPAGRGGPARECFFYGRAELVQDPNSHHAIPRVYVGSADVRHRGFGPFTCHGGPMDGAACDPKGFGVPAPAGAECGAGGGCAGTAIPAVSCIGYGPPDLGSGFDLAGSSGAPAILIATEPRYALAFPPGVAGALPVRGILVWNSHAINGTAVPTTNEQWLRLFFAPPAERRFVLQSFLHVPDILIADVPPFTRRRYCTTITFRPGTRLFELTSHTHERGVLFEAWGPGVAPCSSRDGGRCDPEAAAPVLRTLHYADPDQALFRPPLLLDDPDPTQRTFKYCAVYDNGSIDPSTVKRRSTAPPGALTCADDELVCLGGAHGGERCDGAHARCASAPGAGDGLCDACPLRGWVTADDEMFALLGSYYCDTGIDCVLPAELPHALPPGAPPLGPAMTGAL